MKKYVLLMFAVIGFAFTSCSSDDDSGSTENSIVATWTLESMSPPVLDMSCPEDPTITFNEDGTTTWTLYDPENECSSDTSSGEWEHVSGSTYMVNIPGYGDVEGEVTFSGANSFSFNTQFVYQGMTVPVVLNFQK